MPSVTRSRRGLLPLEPLDPLHRKCKHKCDLLLKSCRGNCFFLSWLQCRVLFMVTTCPLSTMMMLLLTLTPKKNMEE